MDLNRITPIGRLGTAQAAFVIWANLVIALDGKRESANV